MKTDAVWIENNEKDLNNALNRVEGLCEVAGLTKKQRLHIRLLAEEAFGMVRAIVGDFRANFWADENGKVVRLVLEADASVGEDEKEKLLSVSTEGEKVSEIGLMTKIWTLYRTAIKYADQLDSLEKAKGKTSGKGMILYGEMGKEEEEGSAYSWSLNRYRQSVKESSEKDEAAQDAWDELEKSLVANLADEIRVSVSNNTVRLVLYKNIEKGG